MRYTAADKDGGNLHVTVRRGPQTVYEGTMTLKPTPGWAAWRWAELPVPELPPGRYHITLSHATGSPDLDVLGWRPAK